MKKGIDWTRQLLTLLDVLKRIRLKGSAFLILTAIATSTAVLYGLRCHTWNQSESIQISAQQLAKQQRDTVDPIFLKKSLKGHQDRVLDAMFSPNGQFIATRGRDKTLQVWDLDGNRQQVINGLDGHVKFNPSSDRLVTHGFNGVVDLRRLQNRQFKLLKRLHHIHRVEFDTTTDRMVTIDQNNTIQLRNNNGKVIQLFQSYPVQLLEVKFSPKGDRIVTTDIKGMVQLWDLKGNLLKILKGHLKRYVDVTFSPKGNLMATKGGNGKVQLWTLNGQRITELKGDQGPIRKVLFSPKGDRIITLGEDFHSLEHHGAELSVRIWNTEGKQLQKLWGHQGTILDLKLDNQGHYIATSSTDKTVRLWDINGQAVELFNTNLGTIYSMQFSPKGDLLVTIGDDGLARGWGLNGEERQVFEGSNRVQKAKISPTGNQIIILYQNNTPILWSQVLS